MSLPPRRAHHYVEAAHTPLLPACYLAATVVAVLATWQTLGQRPAVILAALAALALATRLPRILPVTALVTLLLAAAAVTHPLTRHPRPPAPHTPAATLRTRSRAR